MFIEDGPLAGTINRHGDTLLERAKAGGASSRPPCEKCPKIPPDAPARRPEYAIDLSQRNEQAFAHYKGCAAVSWNVPQHEVDDLVRDHAAIIKEEMDDALNLANVKRMEKLELLILAMKAS